MTQIKTSPTVGEEKFVKLGIDTSDPAEMAKLFGGLTHVYGDPVRDITRETVSNAIDTTMTLPEKDRKPIEITSPTVDNPNFIVEDFGEGMTAEVIENNYISFLSSTKTDDPNQIGSHGQGAKAPLTYCSKFTVITTKNDTTIEFEISRTDEAYKYVFVNVEEESGQPNGTKVIIPAKPEDYYEFNEALNSYRNFAFDIPLIIDGQRYEVNDEYVLLADDFILSEERGVAGRVFILRSKLVELFDVHTSATAHFNGVFSAYSLGGWIYKNPEIASYFYDDPSIIVELAPDVVDFTKSRSDITKNEKSRELNKRLSAFLKSEETRQKFLNLYKGLSENEALKFLFRMSYDKSRVQYELLEAGDVVFDFDDFITDSGFDPLRLIYTDHDVDAYAIMNYGPSYSNTSVQVETQPDDLYEHLRNSHNKADLTDHYPSNYARAMVSKVRDFVKDKVSDGEAASSTGSTLAKVMFQSRNLHYEYKTKIMVATGVTEKNTNAVLSGRRILSESFGYHILVLAKDDEQVKKVAKKFEDFLSIEVMETDDLVEKIKVKRAEIRANRTGVETTAPIDRAITVYSYGDFENVVEDAKEDKSLAHTTSKMKLEDVLKSDPLVVIAEGDKSFLSTLKGMANSDEKIAGNVVRLSTDGLLAAHYTRLLSHDDTFVSKKWKYHSNDAHQLKATRTFHDDFFNAAIGELSAPDIVSALLYAGSYQEYLRGFLKTFAYSIIEKATDGESHDYFDEAFTLMTAMDLTPSKLSYEVIASGDPHEIVENYDFYYKLKEFINTEILGYGKYGNYNASLEMKLLKVYVSDKKKDVSKTMQDQFLKFFYDGFVDFLS